MTAPLEHPVGLTIATAIDSEPAGLQMNIRMDLF